MTEEYRRHLCDLLESYAPRFRLREPVVCLDEKSGHLLDMAEIGIGIRDRQPPDRRMPDREVIAWQPRHNAARRRSERTFPRPDADARRAGIMFRN